MKSTSKRISKSFIVVSILVILLTGSFLFRVFTRAKAKPVIINPVAVVHPHKKHRKKHKHQKYIAANPSVKKMDTMRVAASKLTLPKPVLPKPAAVAIVPVKPVVVSALPVKQVVAAPVVVAKTAPVKLFQDTTKTTKPNNSYLYATYIHANVTGIVKMRINDQYNSNAVANIPGNSKVLVLAKGASFYKVSYNNNVGFIPKWTLQDK